MTDILSSGLERLPLHQYQYMMSTPAFSIHTSFSPLISLYDAFLLDQFGVIHNGSEALYGSKECIQTLVNKHKKLAILSNTSSPSHVAKKKLPKFGLNEDMFIGGLVSSGEECAKFIRNSPQLKKALWLSWNESEKQNPMQFLNHCEVDREMIEIAESIDDADFILLHGSEVCRKCRELSSPTSDEVVDLNFLFNEDYSIIDDLLDQAIQRSLPMVCANPDLIVGLFGGKVGNMPGKIAERYAQKGGKTIYQFGKPNPRHFHACLDNLGIPFDETKSIPGVAHVGDSLEHDIAGANAAGIDSVFVLGGIHAEELGLVPTGISDCGIVITDGDDDKQEAGHIAKQDLNKKLQLFFKEKGICPTHVIPSLTL